MQKNVCNEISTNYLYYYNIGNLVKCKNYSIQIFLCDERENLNLPNCQIKIFKIQKLNDLKYTNIKIE